MEITKTQAKKERPHWGPSFTFLLYLLSYFLNCILRKTSAWLIYHRIRISFFPVYGSDLGGGVAFCIDCSSRSAQRKAQP